MKTEQLNELALFAGAGGGILGSGSIAIACDLEGFDLVGCEIDADYIAGARKRLADHQAQPRLFDMPRPTAEQLSLDTNTDEAEAA